MIDVARDVAAGTGSPAGDVAETASGAPLDTASGAPLDAGSGAPLDAGSGAPLDAGSGAPLDADAPHRRDATARLFLALWPAPATRARLVAWREACAFPAGASVVAAEKLHVTLHFIGAVPRAAVSRIESGLALEPGAFDLRFGSVRVWAGGFAVLEPHAVPPGLRSLHARLAEALRSLRLPVEARAYRPHVTLSRRATGTVLTAPPPELRWRLRSYVLVESRPGPRGGYDVLRRYG